MIRMSALSTEWVRYRVTATVNGAAYDPTGDPVVFAFLPLGTNPAPGDWVTGTWETNATVTPPLHLARCLIGPGLGGHVLAKGDYVAWLKITDSPEIPVRSVGNVSIT